jgi:GNAT superfamily N-acetyltransferase
VFKKKASDRVWCAPFRRDRRELLPLFRLADDSEQQILSYLHRGEVLFATESGEPLGHVLIIEQARRGVLELKSIAVLESHQGKGIGGKLMRAAVRFCRARDAHYLKVSTSIADAKAIQFYLRCGFRASSIVRDAFTPERGYAPYVGCSRVPLNDAIELELVLETCDRGRGHAVACIS